MKRLVTAFVMVLACGIAVAADCPTPVVSIRGPCPDPCPDPPACVCNPAPSVVVDKGQPPCQPCLTCPEPKHVIETIVVEKEQEGRWIGSAGVARLDSWIFSVGTGYRFPSGVAVTGNILYSDDDAGPPNTIRVKCKKYTCPSCPDAKDFGVGVNVTWDW